MSTEDINKPEEDDLPNDGEMENGLPDEEQDDDLEQADFDLTAVDHFLNGDMEAFKKAVHFKVVDTVKKQMSI